MNEEDVKRLIREFITSKEFFELFLDYLRKIYGDEIKIREYFEANIFNKD